MPQLGGGTPRRLRGGQSTTSTSLYTYFLQGFGILLLLYSVGIITWQHYHFVNIGVFDVGSIISSTKEAFITEGKSGSSRRRAVANEDNNSAVSSGGGGGVMSWISNSLPDLSTADDNDDEAEGNGAIIPVDLSINFLKVIEIAPGAPPHPPTANSASKVRPSEDFLPIVTPSEIQFRWAHQSKVGSNVDDTSSIQAYRIHVRQVGTKRSVWDSEKVYIDLGGIPNSVGWGGASSLIVGQILEWKVQVWDANNQPSSSSWSKFAVGPEIESEWKGKWIAHPSDMDTFNLKKNGNSKDGCSLWKKRRPLPLFRKRILGEELDDEEGGTMSSALLVVSGLGSFRASFNGVPLTTSGPIDPPFTDYSKRVSYRGFDVTSFITTGMVVESHVIGVTMGSGWWDHRPVSGMAKPQLLPRGPATVIAQLIITYSSGRTRVVGETGGGDTNNQWQVSRGHIRESDLFTGEMVDLGVFADMEGWDTSKEWSASIDSIPNNDPYQEINKWIQPVEYHTEVTGEERKQELAVKAKALNRADAKKFPKHDTFAAPIGKLVPSEIPPILPIERIAADEIRDLGGGRWLLDYGKAFSGMLHFDEGVPTPIIPDDQKYPRAHGFKAGTDKGESFITVIYGESLEMTTGDINRVLTAGLG